jgi:hypothetical protein
MNKVKFVQNGNRLSFESYGEEIAVKYHAKWVPTKLITPGLAKQLKERIRNEQRIL